MTEVIIAVVITLLGGGLLNSFISSRRLKDEIYKLQNESRKLSSETDLNRVSSDKIVVSMALELSEEVRQFYEIRIAFMEQRIVQLERTVAEQEAMIQSLKEN